MSQQYVRFTAPIRYDRFDPIAEPSDSKPCDSKPCDSKPSDSKPSHSDPFVCGIKGYKYTTRYKHGDLTTISPDMFDTLYHDFTYNLFKSMPRFTVASHSGGSLHDILAHRFVSSYRIQDATNLPKPLCDIVRGYCDDEERDIDLFLYGKKQENIAQICQIIDHLRLRHTLEIQFYRSIIDVRIKSIPRVVQLIVTNLDCPQQICDGFDFSHLAQYYDGRDVMLGTTCIRAHQTQITRQTKPTGKPRIYKAVSRDYLVDLASMYHNGWMHKSQLALLGYEFADLETSYHSSCEHKKTRSDELTRYIVPREGHDEAVENTICCVPLVPCQIAELITKKYNQIPTDDWIKGYCDRVHETHQFNPSFLRAKQHVDLSAQIFIDAIYPPREYAFVLRRCKILQRVPRCANHDNMCYHVTIHTDESQPVCQYARQTTDRWYRGEYVEDLREMAKKQRKVKDRFVCDQWDKRADWHVLTDSAGLTKENATYEWIAICPRIFRTPDGMCGMYWRIEGMGDRCADIKATCANDDVLECAPTETTPPNTSVSYDTDEEKEYD
jgi:hypothetical protein